MDPREGKRYAAEQGMSLTEKLDSRGVPVSDDDDPIDRVTITFKMKSGKKYKVRVNSPDKTDHGFDYLSGSFADQAPESVRKAHIYDGRFFPYTCWVKMYVTGRNDNQLFTSQEIPARKSKT